MVLLFFQKIYNEIVESHFKAALETLYQFIIQLQNNNVINNE